MTDGGGGERLIDTRPTGLGGAGEGLVLSSEVGTNLLLSTRDGADRRLSSEPG